MWITSGRGLQRRGDQARACRTRRVDSWRMVFDPAVVAKFADCGVSILDAPSEVVGTVLLYIGRNPTSNSPEDLKAAEQVLRAMRPYVRYVDSSRYIDNLANGDICLVMGWSGDIKQAHDRAKEAGKGIDMAYSIPQGGRHRQLRRARHPGGCPAREERAPVHRLPAAPGGGREELQPHQVRQRGTARTSSRSIRRCATTPASTRRPRCANGCVPSGRGRRTTSAC